MATSRWIKHWDPDDERFWERTGKRIARRNLSFSIFAEFLGFTTWLLWSIVVTKLPDAGFALSDLQLFTLAAIPPLVGATLRFPYTFAVPRFGGRNWTVVSALLLLIPLLLLGFLVQHPETPFAVMALAAATAGLGGGNFASSMANISFFYPDGRKGFALGLNAAGGNLGVAVVQLLTPLVIVGGSIGLLGGAQANGKYLQNAAFLWIPLVLIAAACAYMFMDNLTKARSNFRDQAVIARKKQTWIMSVLYVGTFGSFIGYSGALPLLTSKQFPGQGIELVFLGALVGSLARPLGGWMSDRLGGARVTFWNFVVMILAVLGVIFFLQNKAEPWAFAGFLTMFCVLFVTTGIGNGSTFRMIPVIYRTQALAEAEADGANPEEATKRGLREAAAALGFTSAIGAYGGFVIPQGFGLSTNLAGSVVPALCVFIGFYLVCIGLTWAHYLRRAPQPQRHGAPSLAEANA